MLRLFVPLGVLITVGPCVVVIGLVALDAISVATYPTPLQLTVRNDTDEDVTIEIENTWDGRVAFPPRRTISIDVHRRPHLQFTTLSIDRPFPKRCSWSDVHDHQPLVIADDGAHCQNIGGTPQAN